MWHLPAMLSITMDDWLKANGWKLLLQVGAAGTEGSGAAVLSPS